METPAPATSSSAAFPRAYSAGMAGEVEKGDLVVVSPALKDKVKDGDPVVVRVEPDDTYLKRFARSEGRAILYSSNHKYRSIIIDADREVTIIGKAMYTIHHYK